MGTPKEERKFEIKGKRRPLNRLGYFLVANKMMWRNLMTAVLQI